MDAVDPYESLLRAFSRHRVFCVLLKTVGRGVCDTRYRLSGADTLAEAPLLLQE